MIKINNILITTFILISLSTTSFCQNPNFRESWNSYNLKGKVKKIIEHSYSINHETGKLSRGPGRNKNEYNHVWDGFIHKFNDHGFLTDKHYLNDNYPSLKYHCEYEDGDILSCCNSRNGNHVNRYLYKYNPDGTLKFMSEDIAYFKYERSYIYNDEKKIIKETCKTERKNQTWTQVSEYLYKNKNEYTIKIYGAIIKDLEEIHHFILNKDGKVISKKIIKYPDSVHEEYTLEIFKFNSNNDLIESSNFDSDSGITKRYKYFYKYDNKRNWVKRTTTNNDYPIHIVKRSYEYFTK